MGAVAGFAPSRNGLHYSNTSWPNVPDLQLPTPFGPINIGSAANGLCGGMALAVADLWTAKVPPPPSRANPQQRSAAFNDLVSRLFDSFNIPGGVTQYCGWMNTHIGVGADGSVWVIGTNPVGGGFASGTGTGAGGSRPTAGRRGSPSAPTAARG